jgi:hypothetical protein
MAEGGLWDSACEIADAATQLVKQALLPTRSNAEITLKQQARTAAVGDELSTNLEKLADHDENKVAKGLRILAGLLEGSLEPVSNNADSNNDNSNSEDKNGKHRQN